MIEETAEKSGLYFDSGFLCAESVLKAVTESKDLHSELIPKIATGFCSGLARTCGLCGAVSGAIMCISLQYGRNTTEVPVDKAYSNVQIFLDMFERKFQFTNCLQLTGCDLSTEEGRNSFKEENLKDRCRTYVEEATRITMSIIKDEKHQS